MNKYNVLLLILSIGCTEPQTIIEQKREMYVITKFNPPKHCYVDLKRLSDNVEFEHVYVSKHFNGWKELKPLDKEIFVTRQKIKCGDKTFDKFIGIEQAIRNN